MSRISKIEYYLNIAKAVSLRGTCLRKRYGTIIVNEDSVISSGYNGSPRGEINCCDMPDCFRKKNNIPSGERYESCVSNIHSETNAIISAGRKLCIGSDLYLYGYDLEKNEEIKFPEPCKLCRPLILNSEIKRVITIGKVYLVDDWRRK
jgi:dCMP deaminase